MKYKKLFLILVSISFLSSCIIDDSERTLPPSTGKAGELIIVVDTLHKNGATGSAIQDVFLEEIYGVPRSEPLFRVVSVPQKGFTSMLRTVRSILELNIKASNTSKVEVKEDVWAKDQLVVSIYAKSDESAAAILRKNKDKLQDFFNQHEVELAIAKLSKNLDADKMKAFKEKFGFEIDIPKDYFVSMDSTDFYFIRKNKQIGEHQVLQGLMIYTYPYVDDSAFVAERIVAKMNEYIQFVKGQPRGYMTVETQYPILKEEISMDDKYAVKLSGLWKMQDIFMGGSFVNYTTLSVDNKNVIGLYGFVYAPKFNHREYIREMQALANSISFSNNAKK